MLHYDDGWEEPRCCHCDTMDKKLSDCEQFLRGVIECLYVKNAYDEIDLEFYLGELCHILKIPQPKSDILVEQKNKLPGYLVPWLDFTKKHLNEGLKL